MLHFRKVYFKLTNASTRKTTRDGFGKIRPEELKMKLTSHSYKKEIFIAITLLNKFITQTDHGWVKAAIRIQLDKEDTDG